MLDKIFRNIQKKSLKERFLLFIGILFFLLYFVLGLVIIFVDNFPLYLSFYYRIAFGVLLMVYAYIRFVRIIKDNQD